MAFKLTIGPPQLVLHQGHSVLVTDRDGQIHWPSDKGLYFLDTRIISSWQIYANGVPWDLLSAADVSHYALRIFLTNRAVATESGEIRPHSLQLTLSRWISGGVHEDIDIVNYGPAPVRFNLEIALRCDFADLFEVRAERIARRGRIVTQWSDDLGQLRTSYRNRDFCREVTVRPKHNSSRCVYANGRISFEVDISPKAAWHSCLLYEFVDGSAKFEAPATCIDASAQSKVGQRLENWEKTVLKIRTSNDEFADLFRQAIDDMAALRLPIEGRDQLQFVPAAGVPWYVALFGRDSLIASLQNAIVYPGFACASLEALGARQAAERDDYRDAEPGKIMHEMRFGELAHLELAPHSPYYGTADATMLYLIVLHTAWRCTGDGDLLRRQLNVAERCLQWIDEYGDRDGDGFQEYETRSSTGYENQGWKDSAGSVMYPDGSPVKGPKALCELQGYVYDAWLRTAEIFDFLGKADRARTLRAKAEALFRRFNDVFWDDAAGFYAYALDGDKKKVMTVASNIGHCLWSGIVPADRAGQVVRRLMEPDIWSGWGVRTLSADNPAYNPHSYHNGSVWPHDNGIIAAGFRRYGFVEEAARIACDVSSAATHFVLHQTPELYAGAPREPMNFPVQYFRANAPQAWAAGSAFAFLQTLLGFQPDAPRDKLYLDPALPEWLPDVTLIDLKIGSRSFDVRFWREGVESRWEVLGGSPEAVEYRNFASGRRLTWRADAEPNSPEA